MTHRPSVTPQRLRSIRAQLIEADWAVLEILKQLRVATGLQLQLLTDGPSEAARHRRLRQLSRLSRLGAITRMDRRVVGGPAGGSSSTVYTLDIAGLKLLDSSGIARRPWQPSTAFVAHAVAVTQVYVDLVDAQQRGHLEVLSFDAEPKCWRHFTNHLGLQVTLKPDADVTLGVGEFEQHAFVEVDRATESRPRITRMARDYIDYFATGIEQARRGVTPHVVFLVPDDRRQAAVVDALHRLPAEQWHHFGVAVVTDTVAILSGQMAETVA